MGRQCWYRNGDSWIAGIVVAEKVTGLVFKKKMYLVEVNRQSIFPPFEKWVDRELMEVKNVIFEQ
ncbi:MAG: hypothetical protein RR744_10775 [Cellulosilyticaceae bacterium]